MILDFNFGTIPTENFKKTPAPVATKGALNANGNQNANNNDMSTISNNRSPNIKSALKRNLGSN